LNGTAPQTIEWPPELGRLPFRLTPAELRERSAAVLAEAADGLRSLGERRAAPTLANFLEPLDRLLVRVHDLSIHGGLLFGVHPDPEVRAAGREVGEAADRFLNEYRLDGAIYEGLGRLELSGADDATIFAVSKMRREMRRSGAETSPATRSHLLEVSNAIDRTSNQFMENIARLERAIEVDGPAALRGLPADYLAAHPPDARGKVRITTRYPDFRPVMSYCDDASVRRALLFEFLNRAHPENGPVLRDLLSLRSEFARTLGYPHYAAYALEDKMIGTPHRGHEFLERVKRLLWDPATRDLARYLERKRRDLPESTALDPWDGELFGPGYYDGKIRDEEFGVDARILRDYLPYGRVRDGLFHLCRDLFGLSFARVSSAEVWHPTVEAYDVRRGNEPLGRCYLDLIPREGKFTHAACFAVREGLAGVQYPQACLVCNFLDPSVPPEDARMEWRDVVTFFHEFGHLLHALLSGQPRWLYNGQSHVEWDFIEAPSQLFEEWARDPATLSTFARNPDTGAGIPTDLLERLRGAEALGRPARLLRQVAFSAISLEYYEEDPKGIDPSVTYRSVWDRSYPWKFPDEYHPESAFGHLTGYSAFYYTYVWSIVIARDLLSPFDAKGTLTDPATAVRYAREILAPGSSRPAAELIRSFLGRDFTFDAFERWSREPPVAEPGRGSV
jgi:thimet oligopeptidase